jgi:acyl-CoA thioester hydrolase
MMKPTVKTRSDFHYFIDLGTRWSDNDIYGHVNNVMYYSYFDTTANRYLIDEGGLDIHAGNIIGLVVDSGCSYFAPVAFPDQLEGGLAISKLGNSSVRYEIGIFKKSEQTAVAQGHFVHVFVDRAQRQSTPIPEKMRVALGRLLITN